MHTIIRRFLLHALALSSLVLLLAAMHMPLLTAPHSAQSAPDAGATPAGPDGSTPIILEPTADTYVESDEPEEAFGDEQLLLVDEEQYSEAFLRFDVTGIDGGVQRATLRLWVANGSAQPPSLWDSSNVTWSESELDWSTRPAVDSLVEEKDEVEAEEGSWLDYDVTSVVAGNGSYTFALIPESTDGMDVNSREADNNGPQLVIEPGAGEAVGSPVAPNGDDVPVLLAAGDIASCDEDGDEQTAALLDDLDGTIAVMGDAAYGEGTEEQFAECYDPTWGRHKDRTRPAPGNHEYRTEGAAGYFAYFGSAAGDPSEGYYSYDIGTWHIVVLNTNIDIKAGSEQEQWLRQDLETNPAQCTIAYWHHPRFSSGEHGNNPDIDPLYTALYDHGVEVLLAGHDHNYERFAPQNPGGEADPDHGIRQFIVGTGGIHRRSFGEIQPNSEVRNADVFGVLRLALHPDHYEWGFMSVEGSSFGDNGSGTCHDAPETTSTGRGRLVGTSAWIPLASNRAKAAGKSSTR